MWENKMLYYIIKDHSHNKFQISIRFTGKKFIAIEDYMPDPDETDYINVQKGDILYQVAHEYNTKTESVFQKMNGQYGLLPFSVVKQVHIN